MRKFVGIDFLEKVHDVNVAYKLIREDDEVVYGDSGYHGGEGAKNIDCS